MAPCIDRYLKAVVPIFHCVSPATVRSHPPAFASCHVPPKQAESASFQILAGTVIADSSVYRAWLTVLTFFVVRPLSWKTTSGKEDVEDFASSPLSFSSVF